MRKDKIPPFECNTSIAKKVGNAAHTTNRALLQWAGELVEEDFTREESIKRAIAITFNVIGLQIANIILETTDTDHIDKALDIIMSIAKTNIEGNREN